MSNTSVVSIIFTISIDLVIPYWNCQIFQTYPRCMTHILTLSTWLNLTMPRTRNAAASVPENSTISTSTQTAESLETIRERKKPS